MKQHMVVFFEQMTALVIRVFFFLIGATIVIVLAFNRWLERQANKNRLFRRLLIIWSCGLITWVTKISFTAPPDISGATAAALASVLGLLTVVIGFYQWSRASEDAHEQRRKNEDETP